MVLYLTTDTANFKVALGQNKNCYKNVRYKFNNGPWVDHVNPRIYSKNVNNGLRVDWGVGSSPGFSYDFSTFTIVGTTGVPTYYGCYNMADNAREFTEGCLLGYYAMALQDLPPGPGLDPIFFTDPSFTPYTSFIDSVATELTAKTYNRNFTYSGAGGVRLATTNNPLNYSCFVPIGDVGNTPHTISARPAGDSWDASEPYAAGKLIGQVNYAYQLQKFELTRAELLEFLNACFKSDPNDEVKMYVCLDQFGDQAINDTRPGGILRSGVDGNYSYSLTPYTTFTNLNIPYDPADYENIPAVMPLMLALRLCNWLHNRTTNPQTTYTDDGAYDLTGFSFASGFCNVNTFTVDPETGERTALITRKPGAKYFIPNADEWFKAAFYKGGSTNAGYWQHIFNLDNLPGGAYPLSDNCPHTSATDIAYPLTRLDSYTFMPLRFNCAGADCDGEIIDVDGIAIGADPDGFNGPICFKAFATDDCESAEKCITINIPPRPPCVIEFKTRLKAVAEGNSGTTAMTFTVIRGGWVNKRVTSVDWAVTGHGTNPASANDFVGGVFPSGSLTFTSGETLKDITINIQGDTVPEATEEFLITLSNVTGNGSPVLGGVTTAIGQILNDEPELRFKSDEAELESALTTGALANNFFSFTVLKVGGAGATCSVDWTLSPDGTDPASSSDFAAGIFESGTLTFGAGETSKTISIEIQDDLVQEPDETFKIVLSNPVGASIGTPDTAYGTILDNDNPAKNNFIKHKLTGTITHPEGDSGLTNFDFEIIRVGASGVMPEISVDWAVTVNNLGGGLAPAVSTDFNAAPGPGLFPSGTLVFAENETTKTVTIEIVANTVVDGRRAFALTLSNVVGGTLTLPAARIGIITDDDVVQPPPPATAACQLSPVVCDSFDISGAKIVAIYDGDSTGAELCSPMDCVTYPGVCIGKCGQGTHGCDRAIFDFKLGGTTIGQINLNNVGNGPGIQPDTGIMPPGATHPLSRMATLYVPQLSAGQIPADGVYTFSMTCALGGGCHFGIVWLQIFDTKDNLIYCDCVSNDQLISAELCVGKTANPPAPCGGLSSSSSSSSSSPVIPLFDKASWASTVPEPYKTYLDDAADRWMLHAAFNPTVANSIQAWYASRVPSETWNGIALETYEPFYDIDDVNKDVIATCGPTRYSDLIPGASGLKFNSTKFLLQINTSWASSDRTDGGPLTASQWVDVLTHELGHALGIGIYWDNEFASKGAVVPVNNFLSGTSYTNAQTAYNSITGLTRSKVPLEDGGAAGTVSAHWENNYRPTSYAGGGGVTYYGFVDELMIGYFDVTDPTFTFKLSTMTLNTLVDFGYTKISSGEGNPQLNSSMPMAAALTAGCKHLNCKLPIMPQKDATIYIEDPPF